MKQPLTIYVPMSKEVCMDAARQMHTTPEEIWEMQELLLANRETEASRHFAGGYVTLRRKAEHREASHGAVMEQAACMCTAEVCAHPNGEPCGKPVENPVGYIRDGSRPERPIGLCEECWQRVELLKKGKMQNEDLKAGMEVSVEYDGAWQQAMVIGPVTLTTGKVTNIIGWKLHVGPAALDLTLTADKIFSRL